MRHTELQARFWLGAARGPTGEITVKRGRLFSQIWSSVVGECGGLPLAPLLAPGPAAAPVPGWAAAGVRAGRVVSERRGLLSLASPTQPGHPATVLHFAEETLLRSARSAQNVQCRSRVSPGLAATAPGWFHP